MTAEERVARRRRQVTDANRLDTPKSQGRQTLRLRPDDETVGKFSERIARFLGSWKFIGQMTVFILTWMVWNIFGPAVAQFDPYQRGLVLLTLLLSLQASYAAPLILLAQNRQTDRDRVTYEADRALNQRLIADTEYLMREIASLRMSVGEVATRDYVRSELRDMLDELRSDLREDVRADVRDGIRKGLRKGLVQSKRATRSKSSAHHVGAPTSESSELTLE